MAAKVALCPLGHAFTALQMWLAGCLGPRTEQAYPGNQDVLGQGRVGVLDLDKGELDAAVGELVYQVEQFALCAGQ